MADQKKLGFAICALVSWLVGSGAVFLLFAFSFKTIEVTNVGLLFNEVMRRYDYSEVKGPGTYFIGMYRSLVPLIYKNLSGYSLVGSGYLSFQNERF